MNIKRIWIFWMVFTALLVSAAPAVSVESSPKSVVDMMGREINLLGPAKRVVALTASDCEILFAIGAGDKIVGRGAYCDYPKEALEIVPVESGYTTNFEEIVALHPDVVFMNTMNQTEEQARLLESAGIKVVVSNARSIEETYESIRLIGEVVGMRDEALALIDYMNESFLKISERASGGDRVKTIYFEVSPLEYGLWTAGRDTFMNEIAELVGVVNVFADISGWAEVSQEQVIARDPDIIVSISMYLSSGKSPRDEIMGRAGWGDISAIKSGYIVMMDGDMLSRPGPRLAEAAEALLSYVEDK